METCYVFWGQGLREVCEYLQQFLGSRSAKYVINL